MKQIVTQNGMTCPRCEKSQDLLAFIRLAQANEDKYLTAPIYKCPECRFVFAPIPDNFDENLQFN